MSQSCPVKSRRGRDGRPVAPKVAVPDAASDAAAIRAWNAAAKVAFTESLPRCGQCDRRFASVAARDAHAKRCLGGPPTKQRPPGAGAVFDDRTAPSVLGAKAWGGDQTDRPDHVFAVDVDPAVNSCLKAVGTKAAVCHLCGSAALVASLDHHLDKCEARWVFAEKLRPEAQRLPLPPPPTDLPVAVEEDRLDSEAKAAHRAALDASNVLAARVYVTTSRRGRRAQCRHCGRRSADPDARASHERRCAPEEDDEAPPSPRPPAPAPPWVDGKSGAARSDAVCLEPHGAVCYLCGKPCLESRQDPRQVHACPGCGRGFERLAARKKHCDRCCPEFVDRLSEADASDAEPEFHRVPSGAPDPTVPCFICGKRYGSASVGRHIVACEKRWRTENDALPPTARRKLEFPPPHLWPPPRGDPALADEYEAEAARLRRESCAAKCYGCARTFEDPEARDKHAKTCCPALLEAFTAPPDDGDRPRAAHALSPACHVCGKTLATLAGLRFHAKQCEARFRAAAALEPKHRRPALPKPPRGLALPTVDASPDAVAAWNDAVKARRESAAATCPGERCGRTFEGEAKLLKHMASCCPQILAKRESAKRLADFEADLPPTGDTQGGVVCHLCGKRVLSKKSLPFHYRACLEKWRAVEDEVPAADQKPPPAPPALLEYDIGDEAPAAPPDARDDDLLDDDDDGGDGGGDDEEAEETGEEAFSERPLVRMCYTCGSTRESERSILEHCAGCGARFGATPAGAAALRKHEAACCPPAAADDDSVAPPRRRRASSATSAAGAASSRACGSTCRGAWSGGGRTRRPRYASRDRDLFGDDPPPLAVARATPPDPPHLPLPDATSSDAARDAYSAEAFAIWKSTCPRCAFCDRDFVERDTVWKSNIRPDFNDKLRKHHLGGCTTVRFAGTAAVEATTDRLLLALDGGLAEPADAALRAWLATRGRADAAKVRITHVEVLDKGATLAITGRVFGIPNPRIARATKEGLLGASRGALATSKQLEDRGVPCPDLVPGVLGGVTITDCAVVAVGVELCEHARGLYALRRRVQRAARSRAAEGADRRLDDAYVDRAPFRGKALSWQSAYKRRVLADERDRRNRELGGKIAKMKPTMRTRPVATGQPKHCHAAARRQKADRENRLYNAKIRKALEGIYRKKASRLREHGVEGRNVVDAFAARTALYDDDRAEAKPRRREAWTGATDRDPARDQLTSKGAASATSTTAGRAVGSAVALANARGRKRWPTKLAAFWVQSRATTVAQKLLRRRPKPSVEEVMRAMAKARAEDAAVDEAEAKGPPPLAAKVSSRLGDSGAPPPETAARTAARLAEDDERDAAAKRIRERRKLAEGLRDRETSRVATVGALEDDLRRLEARALEVALERRSVVAKPPPGRSMRESTFSSGYPGFDVDEAGGGS
ncbi:hypothetical protein JL720_2376 [Aureococcus anophagefferens]|nr:hypothetical protein JL720_2376 [Aureococcus anophagefferens]